MDRINRRLLPIKAHFFFFMAAMGPILPQINVIAKQLGISPDVMGFVTSVLPLVYMPAKPAMGYVIDYFPKLRKVIFMAIILLTIVCFTGFILIPKVPGQVQSTDARTFNILAENVLRCNETGVSRANVDSVLADCDFVHIQLSGFVSGTSESANESASFCTPNETSFMEIRNFSHRRAMARCKVSAPSDAGGFSNTITFWSFIILACLGTIGFNVSNCLSDATCFDMLGDKQTKYGAQRVWGTIGFGVTALISGTCVHFYQTDPNDLIQTIAPALLIMIIFGLFDVVSIKWLKLPRFSGGDDAQIVSKVCALLSQKSIAIFLVFATIAGILDSFIIYYMFWYLEEVAEHTNYMASIKLIEGCVVAAECLGGEIIFLLISGKILKRIGYVHCLSFCFFMYSLRFALISCIANPWWLVLVELFMQGCTYALTYTCIVAYAAVVAPAGTSATVQGLVAGMDDGAGFAIGSLIGGQMYRRLGGRICFRIFSVAAFVTGIAHTLVRPSELKSTKIEGDIGKKLDMIKCEQQNDDPSEKQPLQTQRDTDDSRE